MSQQLKNYIKHECYQRREEPFKLSSGDMSHDYFDMRTLLYDSAMINHVCKEVYQLIEKHTIVSKERTNLITMGYGALPLVFCMSEQYKVSPLVIRSEKKEYGKGGQLVRAFEHEFGIFIEDVVTTGDSLNKAIKIIREQTKIKPILAISIVDRRMEPSKHPISIEFTSMFRFTQSGGLVETLD